ncbi:MAG: carboxypeptidase-like regulatory domain-containing protein, partial [Vicinamibacterales bacterium]
DVFFNSRFLWSASAQGEAGRVDIESVALHELGHLLGLSHSALGETELTPGGGRRVVASGSVMFPIALSAGTIADRTLQADDVAGISDLYPAAGHIDNTGSIVGRVLRNGQGIYGVHVVAFNPRTRELIGGFSLNPDGDFVIASLPPGGYILRAEPLDDADAEAFFSVPIDVDVRVGYSEAIVVAPRGGSSGRIEIQVTRK